MQIYSIFPVVLSKESEAMGEFVTTIAGANRRQKEIGKALEWMADGPTEVYFVPEPENPHDANAVRVDVEKKKLFGKKRMTIGYLPAAIAASVKGRVDQLRVTGAGVRAPDKEFDFWNIKLTIVDG